jgi:hypothetical protein
VSRRGPKQRDTLALVEHVLALLDGDPALSANRIVALTGARRQDVLRAVRVLRAAPTRFPIPERRLP